MEQLICNPWFAGGAGLSVGVGVMILALAKWGRKIFVPEAPLSADVNSDHPTIARIWQKINEVEGRQVNLRTILPDTYVRRDDFREMRETQIRMENKLDHFMEDCRKGNCPSGKRV